MVDEAASKGAKVVMGGGKHSAGDLFYQPTILTDVNKDMELYKEEIFGPVLSLIKFETEEVDFFSFSTVFLFLCFCLSFFPCVTVFDLFLYLSSNRFLTVL